MCPGLFVQIFAKLRYKAFCFTVPSHNIDVVSSASFTQVMQLPTAIYLELFMLRCLGCEHYAAGLKIVSRQTHLSV